MHLNSKGSLDMGSSRKVQLPPFRQISHGNGSPRNGGVGVLPTTLVGIGAPGFYVYKNEQ